MKIVLWLFVVLSVSPFLASADSTVTVCNRASFEAAITAGGNINFDCDGTIVLTNSLVVSQATLLNAQGHAVTISGGDTVRLFVVHSNVTLSMVGLTLANGRHTATNGGPDQPGDDASGGAILNLGGTVMLSQCVLSNNYAVGGTALPSPSDAPGGRGLGGAIYSVRGQVTLSECRVIGNQVKGGQGAIHFFPPYPGPAGAGLGGALFIAGGLLRIDQSYFANNGADGGVAWGGFSQGSSAGGNGEGGAIYATAAVLSLTNSLFETNIAHGSSVPWTGPGAGSGLGGVLAMDSTTVTEVQNCSFSRNAGLAGGGSRYAYGGDGRGGAIFSLGNLLLLDSSLIENIATGGGSLLPGMANGGAIYSGKQISASGCTFSQNSSTGGFGTSEALGADGNAGLGGALWGAGLVALTNNTWVGNQAVGGSGSDNIGSARPAGLGSGGALYLNMATGSVVHATIAQNSALRADPFSTTPTDPGIAGGIAATNSRITLRNDIFSANTNGANVWGTLTDGGDNISSDASANFASSGSLNSTDPLLGPLADNGGPTLTMALLPGSPAIDAVTQTSALIDQRGVSRPQGPGSDIGAFEVVAHSGSSRPQLRITRNGNVVDIRFEVEANRTFQLLSSSSGNAWVTVGSYTALQAGQITFTRPIVAGQWVTYRVMTP